MMMTPKLFRWGLSVTVAALLLPALFASALADLPTTRGALSTSYHAVFIPVEPMPVVSLGPVSMQGAAAEMQWFIVYRALNICMSNLQMNCGGTHQAQMLMPSREVCEQVVRDNPYQGLSCWAKPYNADSKK